MAKTNTVRLVDIAREVGVSPVAAGSVLLGSGKGSVRVGKVTSERIREVAREMGYRPNTAARQLKSGKSKTIGVLIDSHAPTVLSEKIAAIEKFCMQRGYRLMFGQAHNNLEMFRRYIDDFVSRGIDGLICASHGYEQADVIPNLLRDIPYVLFLGKPDTDLPCAYIEVDLADGVSQAVRHLAKTGRNKLGMIQMNPTSLRTRQRIEGFAEAINQLGLPSCDEQIAMLEAKDTRLITTDEVAQIVTGMVYGHDIRGIVCVNDIVAGHVIQACKRMGLRVPQDMAVVGCDNSDFSVIIDPLLTTIDHQVDQFAREAVDVLFDRMLGGPTKIKESAVIRIKPKLILRDSA